MIKIIKYNEIDFDQYSRLLEKAIQNTDYADHQFLNIVSNRQWFLLVYGNYEAIMPVSYVRKYGFTFVLMPKLCQQLGVFSEKDDPNINQKFYDFLDQNFLVAIYAFNGDNQFLQQVQKKSSYLIQKNDYSTVKKNYSTHRRRNVRIIGDLVENIKVKKDWHEIDRSFFIKNIKGTSKGADNLHYFQLFKKLLENNIGQLRILEFKNDVQSFVYLYEGKNRRYLSLFINRFPQINPNFPSIMIDHCLQEFIADKDFDFMGSEIENVAKFNERFGSFSYQYPLLSNDKFTLLKKLWKKYRIITNFAP
ncbi:hypothetical protein MHJ94_11335 [Chryseobacterium taklimakanense]|uniref:hypothetical protein n=1 Tax=Chryseobacterium taklimakanense TaxID=536441 RepID=UPI001EF644EA|nr:hypothetical protein [Chryseobacterium taklimakanense]MCG7281883.1 hypothetical protein [Chryseobacterium taklimakanense]